MVYKLHLNKAVKNFTLGQRLKPYQGFSTSALLHLGSGSPVLC